MTEDKAIKVFVDKLEELQAARKIIDDKIAALSLAYETLYGEVPVTLREQVADEGSDIRRDKNWREATLAFFEGRKSKTAKIAQVARKFRLSPRGANTRCNRLVKSGDLVRVKRGVYQLKRAPEATS